MWDEVKDGLREKQGEEKRRKKSRGRKKGKRQQTGLKELREEWLKKKNG